VQKKRSIVYVQEGPVIPGVEVTDDSIRIDSRTREAVQKGSKCVILDSLCNVYVFRDGKKKCDFVGGKQEHRELPLSTMRREWHEEIGSKPPFFERLGVSREGVFETTLYFALCPLHDLKRFSRLSDVPRSDCVSWLERLHEFFLLRLTDVSQVYRFLSVMGLIEYEHLFKLVRRDIASLISDTCLVVKQDGGDLVHCVKQDSGEYVPCSSRPYKFFESRVYNNGLCANTVIDNNGGDNKNRGYRLSRGKSKKKIKEVHRNRSVQHQQRKKGNIVDESRLSSVFNDPDDCNQSTVFSSGWH